MNRLKNSLLFSLFLFVTAPNTGLAIVIPESSPAPLSSDLYLDSQWYLQNNGQTLVQKYQLTRSRDIESEAQCLKDFGTKACGEEKYYDLGIGPATLKEDANIKTATNPPVLVLIDSGIDPDDKRFSSQVYCHGYQPQDSQGKALDGDCRGYDYTAAKNPHRIFDEVGHGSHLMGLIASNIDDEGVRGISNSIKVLPLKFFSSIDRNDANVDRVAVNLSGRLTESLNFAADLKSKGHNIQVVNISGGLPLFAQSNELKQAILNLQSLGVIIVTASGNDSNNIQHFPCSFTNIICVTSGDNNGRLSWYANAGGSVDFIAPGERILSTLANHPRVRSDASFNRDKTYVFRDGSSQASPMVATLVALLRGKNPDMSYNEIMARLHLGARAYPQRDDNSTLTLGGYIQFDRALEAQPKAVVRPIFKNLSHISVDWANKSAELKIPFISYWQSQSSITISATSHTPGINITPAVKNLNLAADEKKSLDFKLNLSNQAESDFKYSIRVEYGDFARTFHHQLRLSRPIESVPMESDLLSYPLLAFEESIETLRPLPNNSVHLGLEFFSVDQGDDDNIIVNLFSQEGDSFAKSFSYNIEKAQNLVAIEKRDLNRDGRPDYVLITSYQEGRTHQQTAHFLTKDWHPLYPPYDRIPIDPSRGYGTLSAQNLRVITLDYGAPEADNNLSHLGSFPILAYMGEYQSTQVGSRQLVLSGKVPEIDGDPDPYTTIAESEATQLYYLEPYQKDGELLLRQRAFTNSFTKKSLKRKRELQLETDQQLSLLYISSQEGGEVEQNRIQLAIIQDFSAPNSFTHFLNLDAKTLLFHMKHSARLEDGSKTGRRISEDKLKIEMQQEFAKNLPVTSIPNIDIPLGSNNLFGVTTGVDTLTPPSQESGGAFGFSAATSGQKLEASLYEFSQSDLYLFPVLDTQDITERWLPSSRRRFFINGKEKSMIAPTTQNIWGLYDDGDQEPIVAKRRVVNTGIVPGGWDLTETYLNLNIGAGRSGALIIDESLVATPVVHIWYVDGESRRGVSPLKWSFFTPSTADHFCSPKRPGYYESKDRQSLPMVCTKGDETTVHLLKFN